MPVHIRPIDRSELELFAATIWHTFGADVQPESNDNRLSVIDLSRTHAAFDGDQLIGTAAAYDLTLAVPGGAVAMAGLTMVSVRPTHRRQGVLRALMSKHEQDVASRNEPISGLWASETTIYSRFGYGVAVEGDSLEVNCNGLVFADEATATDAVRFIDPEEVTDRIGPVHAVHSATRPGVFSRTPSWWADRWLYDGADKRQGASKMRLAVAQRDASVVGYVAYRQRPRMEAGAFAGSIAVIELVGLDPRAEASLWSFMTQLDLFPNVAYWNAPVDTALPWLVDDRRRVRRQRTDTLWLRIGDVPAALTARTYAADGRLRITVEDLDAPAQTYSLDVEAGRASCTPTHAAADLSMRRATLASLYLGGFKPSQLARAGQIKGTEACIRTADKMFAAAVPPWCPEVF